MSRNKITNNNILTNHDLYETNDPTYVLVIAVGLSNCYDKNIQVIFVQIGYILLENEG